MTFPWYSDFLASSSIISHQREAKGYSPYSIEEEDRIWKRVISEWEENGEDNPAICLKQIARVIHLLGRP